MKKHPTLVVNTNEAGTSSCFTVNTPMEPAEEPTSEDIVKEVVEDMVEDIVSKLATPTLWERIKAKLFPKKPKVVEKVLIHYLVPEVLREEFYSLHDNMMAEPPNMHHHTYLFWRWVDNRLKGICYTKTTVVINDVLHPQVIIHGADPAKIDISILKERGLDMYNTTINGIAALVISEQGMIPCQNHF